MIRALAAMFLALAAPAAAQEIVGAEYFEPTEAYGHGAVEGGEYAGLRIRYDDGSREEIRVRNAVFEDTAPRLHDFDGDGRPEVVVVLAGFQTGAQIRVYGQTAAGVRLLAQNAPIGQRNRWLAIAGIADFDGDGRDDIAYVDRPHLARVLRVVSVALDDEVGRISEYGSTGGVSNHRLGAPMIEGGVRVCEGQTPVIVTADAGWRRIVETVWDGSGLVSREVGAYRGPESFAAYLGC